MPIYEYKCNSCGKVFEKIERFSDPPLDIHDECGGAVERMLSASAFQFKGTGWYVTDYARSNGGAKNGSESKKETSSESKSDTSSAAGKSSDSTSGTKSTSSSSTEKK